VRLDARAKDELGDGVLVVQVGHDSSRSRAASMFFNDEDMLLRPQRQRRATMLMWVHNERFFARDLVVGDVLLLGQPDAQGNTTSVPVRWNHLLIEAVVFDVEVQ
jgi:hypothetical protein